MPVPNPDLLPECPCLCPTLTCCRVPVPVSNPDLLQSARARVPNPDLLQSDRARVPNPGLLQSARARARARAQP